MSNDLIELTDTELDTVSGGKLTWQYRNTGQRERPKCCDCCAL